MILALALLGACSTEPTAEPTDDTVPACDVGVKEGDCAPDFELPAAGGGTDTLSSHLGRRVMLVGSAFW